MLTKEEAQQLIGCEVYGTGGEKIGRMGQVYLDDQTNQPEFATVNTGLFGMNESFVPLAEAQPSGDGLTVPFSKDRVKDAPSVSPDAGHLSQDDEASLYQYYDLPYGGIDSGIDGGIEGGIGSEVAGGITDEPAEGWTSTGTAERGGPGHDVSGPNTDDAMTRSEERLDVGVRREETGRARLRKYIETEYVQTSVPVQRERAVIETEPITAENVDQATSGPELSEEEHEVILHEERPVVSKHTEPVERVRLTTQEESREEPVAEELRKERIEFEGDADKA
jgi:hypothetical protein